MRARAASVAVSYALFSLGREFTSCNNVGKHRMAGAKLTTGFFGVQRRAQDRAPSETYADLHLGSGTRPKVSVIVPLYNEQESVRPLYAAIVQAMVSWAAPSRWCSSMMAAATTRLRSQRKSRASTPRLRIVKFRRNYGQTPAMAAGIEQASGEVIVTMDGDLQNDPADIGLLLQKIEEGYDIVVGWRHDRQDKLVTRKIPSRIANWLIGKVTGVPIKDNGCSLKAFRAGLIKQIPLYSEMHRFIPAMASIAGPRIAEIKVRHHARRVRTVQVRAVAHLQGAAGPDGDQDRRDVCVSADALVRDSRHSVAGRVGRPVWTHVPGPCRR